MSRTAVSVLALIVAALLQAGLVPWLSVGGAVPNLLLVVVVAFSLVEGSQRGSAAGFAAGLLFDLLGTGPIGPMALVMTLVGYTAGALHEHMFAEGWLQPFIVLAIAAFATELLYGAALRTIGVTESFWTAFTAVLLPSALYNVVVGLLTYPLMMRFLRPDRVTTFRSLG